MAKFSLVLGLVWLSLVEADGGTNQGNPRPLARWSSYSIEIFRKALSLPGCALPGPDSIAVQVPAGPGRLRGPR